MLKTCFFFFCILRSTVNEDDKYDDYQTGLFTLYPLCLLALRCTIDVSEVFCDNKLLWLNTGVKYQNKPMLIGEFLKVGIFHFNQLINLEGEIMSDLDLALLSLHGMNPNNYSFIKHVELVSNIRQTFLVSKGRAMELIIYLGKSSQFIMYIRSEYVCEYMCKKQIESVTNEATLSICFLQQKWCNKSGVMSCKSYEIILTGIYENKIYENI